MPEITNSLPPRKKPKVVSLPLTTYHFTTYQWLPRGGPRRCRGTRRRSGRAQNGCSEAAKGQVCQEIGWAASHKQFGSVLAGFSKSSTVKIGQSERRPQVSRAIPEETGNYSGKKNSNPTYHTTFGSLPDHSKKNSIPV